MYFLKSVLFLVFFGIEYICECTFYSQVSPKLFLGGRDREGGKVRFGVIMYSSLQHIHSLVSSILKSK